MRLTGALSGAAFASLALALGACGGSNGGDPKKPDYAGGVATPQVSAPPLQLKDSLGQQVNIDEDRGKAVLVTFIYTNCPDICPLIVGHLHAALGKLGPEADKLQIIAVSVDPERDTPKAVNKFLADHQMTGRMKYLVGSRPELERTWKAWHIRAASGKSKKDPELVEHSALVYGVDASGKITTIYPANFSPQMIVHDVPLLASQ
jgi:protein SCO1/2